MKYEIEIEGLPEGWKPVAYRAPLIHENYLSCNGVEKANSNLLNFWLVVEKIQPRRKETDIPLTNSESKLSLSVDECRNVRSLIKDFENLGWFVNPARSLLLQKITEFIKDK